MTLPARLHFLWIGPGLAWPHAFAMLSAAACAGLPEIVLHHTDSLADADMLAVLRSAPALRLSPIDPAAYLRRTGQMLGTGSGLADLYATLDAPVMRADVLRAAILYCEGGLYLDLDTVTVASLAPLLANEGFVGSEYIVRPNRVRRSRSPVLRSRALALDLLRRMLRSLPQGWRGFRRVERWYFRSVTNAAMGADVQGRFVAAYLKAMLGLPADQRGQRCALGPHLLQDLVARPDCPPVTIMAPHVFHPFPPEISSHWFRPRSSVSLGDLLPAETCAVHWYASVRAGGTSGRITPDYVLRHRRTQFYSALVARFAGGMPWPAPDHDARPAATK